MLRIGLHSIHSFLSVGCRACRGSVCHGAEAVGRTDRAHSEKSGASAGPLAARGHSLRGVPLLRRLSAVDKL